MDPIKSLQTIAGIGIFMLLIGMLLAVAYFACWLTALVHCIKHRPDKDKMMWVLIIIFVPLFGMILYFTIGKQPIGPTTPVALPPIIPPRSASGAATIKSDPTFDFSAMKDERQRADAITEALRAESQRNRQRPS